MHQPGFCVAAAFLDEQTTILGDWSERQHVTLQLSEHYGELDPAFCALTSQEARDLAFRLLVLAEHADRRADGLT